ncbi:MAG: serine/threonine-protein kinase [Bryobacteraceae bacterium]|nr:serine/threonine-protein kinase [Bryobacteraceae bacterium]
MDKPLPYQLLEKLTGGSQPIYRVKDAAGRVLVLKTAAIANLTEESKERFLRETHIAASLNHPNLVKVYDSGEAAGMLYQAMDALEGSDLDKAFRAGMAFTWEQKLSIMYQVCAGLEELHRNRIVHRDIKPSNVFLENSGNVKILDYGVARVEASNLTKAGMAVGTVSYMAPEQVRGEAITPATDVFAASALFYQLACGRHPFADADASVPKMVQAILFDTQPPLENYAADAPPGLGFVLNKGLEKDPAKRTATAAELRHAIELCRTYQAPAAPPMSDNAGGGDAGEKTMVLERPAAATGAAAAVRPTREAAQVVNAPPAAKPVYCPSCTFGNPPGTTVCGRCRAPIDDTRQVKANRQPGTKTSPLIFVLAGMVLVLLAAVVYLVVAR